LDARIASAAHYSEGLSAPYIVHGNLIGLCAARILLVAGAFMLSDFYELTRFFCSEDVIKKFSPMSDDLTLWSSTGIGVVGRFIDSVSH
jgi:hypothetical protein